MASSKPRALDDLIVVMRDGLIEQFGAPEELCRRPATSLALRIGDKVAIRLNFEHAQAFDPKTGVRL
jgi:ABC-type Fe3+/spermidine/putrescine transport system ATPase subunit